MSRLKNPFFIVQEAKHFSVTTCRKGRIIFLSLFYNYHCDFSYVCDTVLEPMVWFVDNYVKYLGPLFVGFLITMMGLVIILTYSIIVPYEWYNKTFEAKIFYIILGHWLLVSVLFHYYMAYATKPGFLPRGRMVVETVGICKHCIAPKPPRTHHCRVCNRCILKMDHHCPWLNQCVGHFNHRYFFCTMFYMWVGCFFIVLGSWPSFVDHFWPEEDSQPAWCSRLSRILFYAPYLCKEPLSERLAISENEKANLVTSKQSHGKAVTNCILFVVFTSAAVVLGVGCLLFWHIRLIARGETSIEQHINKQTGIAFSKEGKVYKNPYNFGKVENFRRFFGIHKNGRTFWRHVLLPSTHAPDGDGFTFESATFELKHEIN